MNKTVTLRTTNGYVAVPLDTIFDARMSAKARGVLVYALARQSIPRSVLAKGWTFHVSEIASHFSDGVTAIRSAVRELEALGYAEYVRTPGSGGRFGGGHYVFRAVSPSAPAWPQTPGSRSTGGVTAGGKATCGETARGGASSIQTEAKAPGAPSARRVKPEAQCGPDGARTPDPVCSPQAGEAAPRGGEGAPEAPSSAVLAVLERGGVAASSKRGQALLASLAAAQQGPGAHRVPAVMQAALEPGVQHPVPYLERALAGLIQGALQGNAAQAPRGRTAGPAPAVDLEALKAQVLDRQLRVAGQVTARVQDVLPGLWPALLFEDGREVFVHDLDDYEVIA